MVNRSEIIGVRVTPEEQEKFKNHVGETNEFDSLSRFLRVLAHRHIESDEDEVSIDQDEIAEVVDSAVSPVVEKLTQVEEHVVAIDSTVSDDDKIDKLARDIYLSLPSVTNESELPSIDNVDQYGNASDFELAQAISTPDLWARYFDEDVAEVRRACARMMEYYPDVDYVTTNIAAMDGTVPSHDDIDIASGGEQSSHADFANQSDTQRDHVSVSNTQDENSKDIERRYYKSEGQ